MIRLAIGRPLAVTMISLAVAVLGAAAWVAMPVQLLPEAELRRLQVVGEWPYAAPETVERGLTAPLEAEVRRVPRVERVTSESFEEHGRGRVRIEVEFGRDAEMEIARLELAERIAAFADGLPLGVGDVRVEPWVPRGMRAGAGRVVLRYILTGPRAPEALRARVDSAVIPALSRVRGVALVRALGGVERLLDVALDHDRLGALGLSPDRVRGALEKRVRTRSVGAVRRGSRRWPVAVRSGVRDVGDLRHRVLVEGRRRRVRVSDVGAVRDTYEEPRALFRVDGLPAVGFEVVREIGENTVRVTERVKAEIARLERFSPPGVRFLLEEDEGAEIRGHLSDLRNRALGAAGALLVVLLIFLGSMRVAAIVLATVALSVLAALCLIRGTGLGLNAQTLAGLAVGFGLAVDASIVVVESIHRRWRTGARAAVAAEKGAREVAPPILASTATTLIVLVPFVYLQGELRVYYLPLAIAAGAMLVASVVAAFSFTPSLTCWILRWGPRLAVPAELGLGGELVRRTLRRPWITVGVAAVAFWTSGLLFQRFVERKGASGEGWGRESHLWVRIRMPRGSDLDRTDGLTRVLEARLAAMPQVERFVTRVQGPVSWIRVDFPDSLEDTPIPAAIRARVGALGLQVSGAEIRAHGFGPSFYGDQAGLPAYGITVRGYDYGGVAEIAEALGVRLASIPRVRNVDTDAGFGFGAEPATEIRLTVDRAALDHHGRTVSDLVRRIGFTLNDGAGRSVVRMGNQEVPYAVKLVDRREADVRSLRNTVFADADGGGLFRLGDVVRVEERDAPARIRREHQQYRREVAYEFRGSRRRGDRQHAAVIASTRVPPGFSLEDRDGVRRDPKEQGRIRLVIALSVAMIYLVAGAFFESLRQPFCVLLTLPMALTGVFLVFWCTGATFTREASIALVPTGGIVVNNSILLVDSVNRRRRAGRAPPGDHPGRLAVAIVTGTVARVRPIFMTTATTVLALLPLVFKGSSSGSGPWNAMAYVLIGGLLSSTLLVLMVTPALYLLLEGGSSGESASPKPAPPHRSPVHLSVAPATDLDPESTRP